MTTFESDHQLELLGPITKYPQYPNELQYRIKETDYWIIYYKKENKACLYYQLDGFADLFFLKEHFSSRTNSFRVSFGGKYSQFDNLPEKVKDFIIFNIDIFA